MKIAYKRKFLRSNLILGILWSAVGILQVVFGDQPRWLDFMWFILGAAYLGMTFYNSRYKYLTIEDGVIKENWPFGKEVALNTILQIRKFAGDYTLKTGGKHLKINTQIIDPQALAQLNRELEKLDVEWT